MPGVAVTVTNLDTGATKNLVTNSDGLYDTASILPGNYRVTFTKEGFGKLVRGPITLEVNTITENAALEVGAMTEEVRVVAEGAPLLETETAQQASTLTVQMLNDLPQAGAGITGNDWANFSAAGLNRVGLTWSLGSGRPVSGSLMESRIPPVIRGVWSVSSSGFSPGRNSRKMKCWTTCAISSMIASDDSFVQDEVRVNRAFAG